MARVTVEDALAKEPNRFSLVMLAAKRAKQLLEGAKCTIVGSKNKAVVTALREIADGNVRFMTDEDMKKAKERERKTRQEALARAQKIQEEKERIFKTQAEAGLMSPPLPQVSELGLVDDDEEEDDIEDVEDVVDESDDDSLDDGEVADDVKDGEVVKKDGGSDEGSF